MSFLTKALHRSALVSLGLLFAFISVFGHADDKPYAGLSVQLWSVRGEVESDIRSALERLAAMGFDGVELAGEFGEFAEDPEGFKAYLDKLGLTISGAHVGFDQLSEENLERTVRFYRAMDVDRLIVPMDPRAWNPDGIDGLVADLNRVAEALKPHGMKTGYHNHHREFDAYQESTFLDYLAENTSDDVLLQMDVGWMYFAGADPVTYLRKYRDRIETIHFKAQMTRYADIKEQAQAAGNTHPFGEFQVIFEHNQKAADNSESVKPLIGQDRIDWQGVIDALASTSDPAWFVVEQEIYPNDMKPMKAVQVSLRGLKKELSQ